MTSQPGTGTSQEKFNEIKSPTWTFYVTQSIFSRDLFRFWNLGYPAVRGSDWQGAFVKNLPRIDVEVCTKFGGDWFGG